MVIVVMIVVAIGVIIVLAIVVVMAIVGLLAGLILPALGSARDASRVSVCLSNQRQIGIAFAAYAVDERDALAYMCVSLRSSSAAYPGVPNGPGVLTWDDLLAGYLSLPRSAAERWADHIDAGEGDRVLMCPADPRDASSDLAGWAAVRSYAMVQAYADTALLGDALPAGAGVLFREFLNEPPPVRLGTRDIPDEAGTLLISSLITARRSPFERGNAQGFGDSINGGSIPALQRASTRLNYAVQQFPDDSPYASNTGWTHGQRDDPTPAYLYADGHSAAASPTATHGGGAPGDAPAGAWTRDPND